MRYPTTKPNPPEPTFEGDDGFLGMNPKLAAADRTKLPARIAAYFENIRCTNGAAAKRPGSILPLFCNDAIDYGTIVGAGIYSDPRGEEQLLIATPTEIYRMTSGGLPQAIGIPAGQTLAEPVHFVQVFDKVLALRGTASGAHALQWDGTSTSSFVRRTKSDPADDSTVLIPNTERGIAFLNRFVFPLERSRVGVSDVGDPTSYDRAFNDYLLNLGTSDRIVRLYPMGNSLIVGKENRIEIFSGLTAETATLNVLNGSIGTCAWDSWAMVGGDIFFLSRPGGVYRIQQVIESRLETAPVPVSDAIEPLIRRINWAHADGAVAAVHGSYFYLAVPLDDATANNVLLVYNTVTGQWESCDRWDDDVQMQIDALLPFNYYGQRRLYAVNFLTASVHVLEEGKFDEGWPGRTQHEIRAVIQTRGYATRSATGSMRRDAKRFDLAVATWNPSVEISALVEGSTARDLLTYTRDPRKWNIAAQPNFNAERDDRSAEGRQDYSIAASELTSPGLDFDGEGIDPDQKQYDVIPLSTTIQGRYTALQLVSTQGECDLCAVTTESSETERGNTRRAV